jgi:hypothetical protein
MENLKITVTITDGNKEVKGTTDVKSCESMKNDFGISKIDEMVSMLIDEITSKSDKAEADDQDMIENSMNVLGPDM